jgi:hypothetical protein
MSDTQTVTIPIKLGSKAFAVTSRFDYETGNSTRRITPISITEVTLWRTGEVRHYISGNYRYLPMNVYQTREEAERALIDVR